LKSFKAQSRIVVTFFAFSLFFAFGPEQVFSAETNQSSGFLKAFGGFLNRQATTQTNTASSSDALKSLQDNLFQSATNHASSNAVSLTQRLGTFLNTSAPGATNSSAATNLVQKLHDWIATSQVSGTNTSTNTMTKRAWSALTNEIAAHYSSAATATNSTSQSSLAGTNLVQKLKDWIASERATSTTSTNAASASLASVESYLNSMTNVVQTNSLVSATTSTNLQNQLIDETATNISRRLFRTRQRQ
jgi:hypothetical protein